MPGPEMWKVFADELYLATVVYGIEIHAFVMMPNHFHLLLTTPNEDLGVVMHGLMSYVTRTANLRSGRSGRVFGARYYRSLISSGHYYAHALKYVYRNPVRAHLSEAAEMFQFSTLHGTCGGSTLPFPLHYPRCGHGASLVPREHNLFLSWVNRPFPSEVEATLKKAFRRSEFKIPKDRNTRCLPSWAESLV